MRLRWSTPAEADLIRLHRFLAPKNRRVATNLLRTLRAGALPLIGHPRLGERIDSVEEHEVRRIFVGSYELRYQVTSDAITVLRIWHTREDR